MVVVVHETAKKNDARRDAKNFIPMSPKSRLAFVAPLIEEKDKARAEEFLHAVIAELHREKMMAPIKELLALVSYLKDRSSSLKLILERAALLDLA
jgi:hypothetical protein